MQACAGMQACTEVDGLPAWRLVFQQVVVVKERRCVDDGMDGVMDLVGFPLKINMF